MAVQQVRANFPKDADGNPRQPVFVQSVDSSGSLGNVAVGDVADAATDSGNPVKVGGTVAGGVPSLVAGKRSNLFLSTAGQVLVAPYNTLAGADGLNNARIGQAQGLDGVPLFPMSMNFAFNGTTWDRTRGDANGMAVQAALSANFWNYAAAAGGIVNTATAVTVKAAAGAGVRNYIMSMQIATDTLGAATEFAIRDGAAGTVLYRGKLQTAALPTTTINFEPPLKGTANTLVEIVTLTAVTGGVFANLQGYTGV
jgi:hypothetical protein